MLHIKFGFNQKRCLNAMVIYIYIAPGQGQTTPWGYFFHNTLEPEILYLAYLALEVTSPAIVGLNAFLASPNLP